VAPQTTTTYRLTKLSQHGCEAPPGAVNGQAVVSVEQPPAAQVRGGAKLCQGETTTIIADLTGSGPWTLVWSDGRVMRGIRSNHVVYTVAPTRTTTYRLVGLTNTTCSAEPQDLQGTAEVLVGPSAVVSGDTGICIGESAVI